MSLLQDIMRICTLFFLVLITSQCTYRIVQKDPFYDIIQEGSADVQPAKFRKEIKRLKEVTQKEPDTSTVAKAHLQLAFLYSHYKNPTPDYHRAIKELERYISLDLKRGEKVFIQNWLRMLKEIEKLGRSNEDLKEKLEQLKHLDIELEEKRKSAN